MISEEIEKAVSEILGESSEVKEDHTAPSQVTYDRLREEADRLVSEVQRALKLVPQDLEKGHEVYMFLYTYFDQTASKIARLIMRRREFD